jgi:hypothetical protein
MPLRTRLRYNLFCPHTNIKLHVSRQESIREPN